MIFLHGKIQMETDRITYDSLSNVDTDALLKLFNESFKNYFVPLHFTKQQFSKKLATENIDLSLSAGAFADGEPVGFILHATGEFNGVFTAYNAGTGILPAFRGRNITAALYRFALEQLMRNGIEHSVLEVFVQNLPAFRAYKTAGFHVVRQLESFKYPKPAKSTDVDGVVEVSQSEFASTGLLPAWNPAWQYGDSCVQRSGDYQIFLRLENQLPVAFCTVNLETGRMAQFGCKNFNLYSGHLHLLFDFLAARAQKDLSIIHIDKNAAPAIRSVSDFGFTPLVSSYEMHRQTGRF